MNSIVAPAAHSTKKAEMVTQLAEMDTDEQFWPGIAERITDGEFLSTIAEELKVNFAILRNWIRGNVVREKSYIEAERLGRGRRTELVLERTYEVAIQENADAPSHTEQLRAAEVFLKQANLPEAPHIGRVTNNYSITFVAAKDGREEKVIDQVPG